MNWVMEFLRDSNGLWMFLLGAAVQEIRLRRERKERAKSESELRLIKRRGEGPYLTPSKRTLSHLYLESEGSEVRIVPLSNPNLLCGYREEVGDGLPEGTPIYMVIENNGSPPRWMCIEESDLKELRIAIEAEIEDAARSMYLTYAYDPAQHGKEMIFTLEYEAGSGVQDFQVYCIKHGFRKLSRVDPV